MDTGYTHSRNHFSQHGRTDANMDVGPLRCHGGNTSFPLLWGFYFASVKSCCTGFMLIFKLDFLINRNFFTWS